MGEQALSTYSYEAYLALEAESEVKHEYHDGFIVAMACAKPLHVKLCTQAARAIGNEIDKAEKPCDTFVADLRIRIESVNRAYYPDITVACDSHISSPKDKHALINPSHLSQRSGLTSRFSPLTDMATLQAVLLRFIKTQRPLLAYHLLDLPTICQKNPFQP